jgi:hypothetical protein
VQVFRVAAHVERFLPQQWRVVARARERLTAKGNRR